MCSCLGWLVTQILLVQHNWVTRINISICVSCFIYSTVAVRSCGGLKGTWFIHADTSSGIAGQRLAGSLGPGWARGKHRAKLANALWAVWGEGTARASSQQKPWLAAQPSTAQHSHCSSVLPTPERLPGRAQDGRTLGLWLSYKNSDHCRNIIKELIKFPA